MQKNTPLSLKCHRCISQQAMPQFLLLTELGGRAGGCPTLTNMLVIVVGGIPIAMPTVLSVTLALGAARLAKEGAIVARMSAVEEMAGMSILCSDKTGAATPHRHLTAARGADASLLSPATARTASQSRLQGSVSVPACAQTHGVQVFEAGFVLTRVACCRHPDPQQAVGGPEDHPPWRGLHH